VAEFLCGKNPEAREIMSKLRQKMPRLKLSLAEYEMLRNQVLKRDGWRCQRCGKSNNLHVHRVKSRGNLGDDTIRNLITLCAKMSRGVSPPHCFQSRRPIRINLLMKDSESLIVLVLRFLVTLRKNHLELLRERALVST